MNVPMDARADVADAAADSAIERPKGDIGYLWYAGTALGAFTKNQTQESFDQGPGYVVVPTVPIKSFHDLTFDASGNLWTLPTSGNQIIRIPAAGLVRGATPPTPDLTITGPAIKTPLNLTFDARGNLWVLCYDGAAPSVATIVRLDNPGSQTGSVTMTPSATIDPGTTLASKARFTQGLSIAFDQAGNLWMASVANVLRFDQATALTGTVTASPSAIVTTPGDAYTSLAFDGNGALWITGAKGGYFAIRIANPSSLSGAVSPTPAARLHLPSDNTLFASGMGFESDGSLWVAMNNRLLKIVGAGSIMGEQTPTPTVELGLIYYPDLASKLVFWPGSP